MRKKLKALPEVEQRMQNINKSITLNACDIRDKETALSGARALIKDLDTASAVRAGSVGHPTSGLTMGQEFTTNSGWNGKVKQYKSCYEVQVEWQDGSTSWHDASDIKGGSIKPLYQPSVAGVGYYGEGRFSNGLKKVGETPPEEIYAYWTRMLHRCYNPEEILKNRGRWYVYVEIHKDWFNFQNFAEWAIKTTQLEL